MTLAEMLMTMALGKEQEKWLSHYLMSRPILADFCELPQAGHVCLGLVVEQYWLVPSTHVPAEGVQEPQ